MAQVTEQEAKKGIDKVVNTLRRDSKANEELGKLDKVTTILGYGRLVGFFLTFGWKHVVRIFKHILFVFFPAL